MKKYAACVAVGFVMGGVVMMPLGRNWSDVPDVAHFVDRSISSEDGNEDIGAAQVARRGNTQDVGGSRGSITRVYARLPRLHTESNRKTAAGEDRSRPASLFAQWMRSYSRQPVKHPWRTVPARRETMRQFNWPGPYPRWTTFAPPWEAPAAAVPPGPAYGDAASGTALLWWTNGSLIGLTNLAGGGDFRLSYGLLADGSLVVGRSGSGSGAGFPPGAASDDLSALGDPLGVETPGLVEAPPRGPIMTGPDESLSSLEAFSGPVAGGGRGVPVGPMPTDGATVFRPRESTSSAGVFDAPVFGGIASSGDRPGRGASGGSTGDTSDHAPLPAVPADAGLAGAMPPGGGFRPVPHGDSDIGIFPADSVTVGDKPDHFAETDPIRSDVPEPGTLSLLLLGGLAVMRRARRRPRLSTRDRCADTIHPVNSRCGIV